MKPLSFAIALTIPWLWSCDSQPTEPSQAGLDASQPNTLSSVSLTEQLNRSPHFDPNNFVRAVDNPLFPLRPGTRFVFEGVEDGENETNVTIVTHDRKSILGISATVVLDRVFVHGELKEKTFDWYAQDKQGNVWYLGENTKEYEDGKVVSTEGSWLSGQRWSPARHHHAGASASRRQLSPGISRRARRRIRPALSPQASTSGSRTAPLSTA